MKSKCLMFPLMGLVLVLIPRASFAHHGYSQYDLKKTVTLSGTVTAFDWLNPHCLVHMDVSEANGAVRHWTLEMSPPYTMLRRGWDKDTVKPGDRVSIDTHPAKNGAPIGITESTEFALRVVVNGNELPTRPAP